MTRLLTRISTEAPNGIDRVDLALARYFSQRSDDRTMALLWTVTGPRLFPVAVGRDIVNHVEKHWLELDDEDDPLYEAVVDRILNPGANHGRITRPRRRSWYPFVAAIWNHGLRFGQSPERHAPDSAAYLNASHFPLEYKPHLRWLFRRPDIAPAFFIHDLLPIISPQYFWSREPERHRRRLDHIGRLRGRAIVASATVASQVRSHFALDGYTIPILKSSLPVSPVFRGRRNIDARLKDRPYFVVCGTIEPRKNHALLLNVWREMAKHSGDLPSLVLIGKRGWNAESVIGTLERSRDVSKHVIEVNGLSTPALKRLMDNAVALLAPSLSEGFGLPVLEATTMGLPVIASDIPPYRERLVPGLELINSLDGLGWLRAIRNKVRSPETLNPQHMDNCGFERSVEQFIIAHELRQDVM
jgi:glycosyltransferase involved in cell wall biosynthesis